jgi:hypothetical protein
MPRVHIKVEALREHIGSGGDMCLHHEHKYTLTIAVQLNGKDEEFRLRVDAPSFVKAIAKAEGYVFEHYPQAQFVRYTGGHAAYSSADSALEHHADLGPMIAWVLQGQS